MPIIVYENDTPSDDIADILALLTILRTLDIQGHVDLALDTLYDEFDTRLSTQDCAYCDALLARVNVEDFSPTLTLGFLTISVAARESLPARAAFYDRVAAHFATLFDGERCTRLLQGLG